MLKWPDELKFPRKFINLLGFRLLSILSKEVPLPYKLTKLRITKIEFELEAEGAKNIVTVVLVIPTKTKPN
jgi:hypothetical protein